MNNIYKNQNRAQNIECLRASNALYNEALIYSYICIAFSCLIPTIFNYLVILIHEEILLFISQVVVIILFALSFCARERNKALRFYASSIQQVFDRNVFDLKCSCSLSKDKIDSYLVKYKRKQFDKEVNWYDNYSTLSKNEGIIFCQKENVNWTFRNIQRIALIYLIFLLVLFLPVVLVAAFLKCDITTIINIVYNSVPLLSFICASIYDTFKERNMVRSLKTEILLAEELMARGCAVEEKLSEIQDMIYEFRRNKGSIPKWLYVLFYEKDAQFERDFAKHVRKNNLSN